MTFSQIALVDQLAAHGAPHGAKLRGLYQSVRTIDQALCDVIAERRARGVQTLDLTPLEQAA